MEDANTQVAHIFHNTPAAERQVVYDNLVQMLHGLLLGDSIRPLRINVASGIGEFRRPGEIFARHYYTGVMRIEIEASEYPPAIMRAASAG
jgi:hypothetical protein